MARVQMDWGKGKKMRGRVVRVGSWDQNMRTQGHWVYVKYEGRLVTKYSITQYQ